MIQHLKTESPTHHHDVLEKKLLDDLHHVRLARHDVSFMIFVIFHLGVEIGRVQVTAIVHRCNAVVDPLFGGGRVSTELLEPEAIFEQTSQSAGFECYFVHLLRVGLLHLFRLDPFQ